MIDCIFCRIVTGAAEASLIFEDQDVAAFLDIRPVRPGQVLVVPRTHIDHYWDLPEELAAKVFRTGRQIAQILRRRENPSRVGMIIHGFGVPHAHLIVLPLHHPWDVTSSANSYVEHGQVKFRWEQVPLASRSELDRLAAALRAEFERQVSNG